jgi:type I restriction enzyme, S subunit
VSELDLRDTTIGSICSITTGKLDVNASEDDGAYPFFTCAERVYRINEFAFDTEAVLFAGNGFFNVKYYKGKFNAYQRTYVLHQLKLNGRYLFHYISHRMGKITGGSRGSTIKYIRLADLRDHPIRVPSLETQVKIVAEIETQLSRLDEAVANLQRVKANLKRYKASVLKAAVEGRLVETEGGWRQSTLGEESKIIGGLTKNQKRNDLPLKLPYLRVANVYANELRLDEIEYIGVAERELEKLLVRKGDLLVVEGNGSPDQIGRVALWNDTIPNCVHQNHLIKVRFEEPVMPEWGLIWMLSPVGRHEIEQVSASTSGLHTLSVGKVSRLPLGVPALKEQVRIVAEVDRHLSIIREVNAEVDTNLQRAQALRQACLAAAFAPNKTKGITP